MGFLENKPTREIKRHLKTLKCCWFWKVSDRFTSGIPDFIGCHSGFFFAIEVKRENGKPRLLQAEVMRLMRMGGARTLVTDNVEEVREFMSRFPA